MPLKYLLLHQPDPQGSQLAPDHWRLESAPAADGPWAEPLSFVTPKSSTIDCQIAAVWATGEPKFPGIDFAAGTCLEVVAYTADTDTHARVVATAFQLADAEALSNTITLPEPNSPVALMILVLFLIGLVGIDE